MGLVSHWKCSQQAAHHHVRILESCWTKLCQLLVHRCHSHSLRSEAGSQRVCCKESDCQCQVPKVGERQGSWCKGTNLKRRESQLLISVNTQHPNPVSHSCVSSPVFLVRSNKVGSLHHLALSGCFSLLPFFLLNLLGISVEEQVGHDLPC